MRAARGLFAVFSGLLTSSFVVTQAHKLIRFEYYQLVAFSLTTFLAISYSLYIFLNSWDSEEDLHQYSGKFSLPESKQLPPNISNSHQPVPNDAERLQLVDYWARLNKLAIVLTILTSLLSLVYGLFSWLIILILE